MSTDSPLNQWDEETSKGYINYGRYFVPAREQHMHIIADLLKGLTQPFTVLELCCGGGTVGQSSPAAGHALFSGWKKPVKLRSEELK